MTDRLSALAGLSDADLTTKVEALAVQQRDVITALIACLAEFDARRLYAAEGFPSMYSYCVQHLHLSDDAACRRIEAARTARRFPVVLDMLASGETTMTSLTLLSPFLTEDNHRALLDAARHKSTRDVREQVAAIAPLPDAGSVVTPLGNDRFRLQITLPGESYRQLRRLQDLLRHAVPNGDLAEIVCRSLSVLSAHVERKRLAHVRRPRVPVGLASDSRHVPADIVRAVWNRDEGRCTFVGPKGRCTARGFLELHHIIPFAQGGPTAVENLQLRCRTHNLYELARETGGL